MKSLRRHQSSIIQKGEPYRSFHVAITRDTCRYIGGLLADMSITEILETLGASFTKNRYMQIFILTLLVIGLLERHGLREHAANLMIKLKHLNAGIIMWSYVVIYQIINIFGLRIGGYSASAENMGNFFGQNLFIAAGGILLIKGVLEDAGYMGIGREARSVVCSYRSRRHLDGYPLLSVQSPYYP